MKSKREDQPSHPEAVSELRSETEGREETRVACPYTRYAELYVKGLLFSWEQAAFELHLMECKACLKAVEQERQAKLDSTPQPSPGTWRDEQDRGENSSQRQEDGTSCQSLH